MWRNLKLLHMWRNFRFRHISHAYISEISPHDKFFSTYLICEICDKYEVWPPPWWLSVVTSLTLLAKILDISFFCRLKFVHTFKHRWKRSCYISIDNFLQIGILLSANIIKVSRYSKIQNNKNFGQKAQPTPSQCQ